MFAKPRNTKPATRAGRFPASGREIVASATTIFSQIVEDFKPLWTGNGEVLPKICSPLAV